MPEKTFLSGFCARFCTGNKVLKVFVGLALFACATSLYVRFLPGFDSNASKLLPTDFGVFYTARARAVRGESIYDETEFSPYKYSPGALALVYLLPTQPDPAWVVYKLMCVLLWVITIYIGAGGIKSWSSFLSMAIGIGIISWKGILETLDYGQLEFWVFFFAILAAALYRRAPFWTGFWCGTLIWLKLPWLFYVLPFLFLRSKDGRWKDILIGWVGSHVVWGFLIPFFLFGPFRSIEMYREWMHLVQIQPPLLYFNNINQGLSAAFIRALGGFDRAETLDNFEWIRNASFALTAVIGSVLGVFTLRRIFKTKDFSVPFEWIGPWLMINHMINPLSWRWGSLLAVGLAWCFRSPTLIKGKKIRFALFIVAFALWLIQQNPLVKALGFDHWTDFHPYNSVTYYWLILLLLAI